MQTYKFTTRISENGIISLPNEPELFNTEVKIIIVPIPKKEAREEKYTAKDFLNEFSGCLKDLPEKDTDDLKNEYLKRKHQLFSNDISKEEVNEARNKYLTEKYK